MNPTTDHLRAGLEPIRQMVIQAANTQSFDSVVNQITSQSIPLSRPAMPPVQLYATPLYLNGPVVLGNVSVPVVSSVQAVQINPTTFENSGDVLDGVNPAMTHYSAQFGFANPDQNSGLALQLVMNSHLVKMEQMIQAAINSVITEPNFATAPVSVASSAWAVANLEALLGSVPSATALCLDTPYFVKTKSTWMPSGKEGLLSEFSEITGVGTDIRGFVARPEAIALVIGYPSVGPSSDVTTSKIRLPIGLDVQFSRWWSRGGRSWRASLDICLGPEVGQPGAMRLLKTA